MQHCRMCDSQPQIWTVLSTAPCKVHRKTNAQRLLKRKLVRFKAYACILNPLSWKNLSLFHCYTQTKTGFALEAYLSLYPDTHERADP